MQVALSGDEMTIALPGSSKLGLSGLLGRKRDETKKTSRTTAKKQLEGHEIAKLFKQDAQTAPVRPAKLNDAEKQDRARLSSLRGALYSKD